MFSVTSLEKEVMVGDIKVTLAPLHSSEEMKMNLAVSELNGLSYLLQVKQETLSYAIKKIDDEVLPDVIENTDKPLYVKEKFLAELSQYAVDTLFNAYLVLGLEVQDKLKKEIKFDNADYINRYVEGQATEEKATAEKSTPDAAQTS